jgi:hypothetical protein
MPNLLQYVSNGNYYARIKVNGKLICESLRTVVVQGQAQAFAHGWFIQQVECWFLAH